jgi:hypothetical protein
VVAENGQYGFVMTALYVGTAEDEGDFTGLDDWFSSVYPDNLIDSSENTFDTFYDKLLNQVIITKNS